MDNERFRHVRDCLGYDNERMAKALNIGLAEVDDFCVEAVPTRTWRHLESFADWSMEVGDARSKKELAKKYLGGR